MNEGYPKRFTFIEMNFFNFRFLIMNEGYPKRFGPALNFYVK